MVQARETAGGGENSIMDGGTRLLEVVGKSVEDGVSEPLPLRIDARTLLMLIPADGFVWALGGRPTAAPGDSECVMSMPLDHAAEVDRLAAAIEEAGGSVLTPPEHQDRGCTALCADPDGHAWQLNAEPVR